MTPAQFLLSAPIMNVFRAGLKSLMAIATLLFSISAFAQPNLTPYQPGGWSDKIVVSTVTGTHIDALTILPTNWLYVDYAVANFGSAATSGRWWTYLYVDNVLVGTFFFDAALNPNFFTFFNDYN